MAAAKSIAMTLSLTDKATPELERFKKSLQGLEPMLASINKAFQTFTVNMTSVGEGAAGATGAMNGVTTSATSLESKISQAAASMRMFAGASGETAAAAGVASTEINRAGNNVEGFERKMHSLGSTIKGVGEIWAASKIGHGLEEAVKSASGAQDTQARIANIGGPEVQALVNDAVEKARKAVPQIEKTELAKMALDIYAASGHKESIGDLAEMAKSLFVMQKSDASGQFGEQSTLNTFKALELRGSMMDPKRRDEDLEQMMKASIATQGRVGPDQFYMFLKTLKNGEAQAFDKSFFSTATALIEEMGASRAATMINAMQRTVSGSQIKKELIPNWKELGLLSKDGKSMDHMDEFRANPVAFIQKYVLPALQKKGVDVTDETEISKAATKLFGNQNGQEGLYSSLARAEQLKKQSELIDSVSGKEAAYAEISKTASSAAEKFHASLDAFGQTIGAVVLPMLTELLGLVGNVVDFFNEAAQNPIVAWGITIASVTSAAMLAVKGVISVFGFLAPAAEAGAAGVSAAFAAGAMRWTGYVAVAAVEITAIFAFYDAIKNFEVFGTTIEDVFNQTIAFLIGKLSSLFTWITQSVGQAQIRLLGAASSAASFAGFDSAAGKLDEWKKKVGESLAAGREFDKFNQDFVRSFSQGSEKKAKATLAAKNGPGIDMGPGSDGGWADAPGKKKGGGATPSWASDSAKAKGTGRGRNPNDIAANIESENAKFEREKTALELKATEALYREHEISIDAYFAKKVATIKAGTEAEIAALEKEKATLEKDPARNADKINAANHKIVIAQMKEKQELLDAEREKRKAMQSLTSEGLNLEAKLESLTKSASKAKIELLDIEYQKKRKLLQVNGDLQAMQALDALHMADVAKVKYDDLQTKNNLFKGSEKTAEMQANADAKKGLITDYEAQQKIVEAKREQGAQELANLDAMMQYAETIKDPALIEAIKQARIEAQGLVDTLDVGAQQFRDTFHSAIQGGLTDLLNGKFTFRKFFDSISQQLNATLAKGLSDTITNSLFGPGGMLKGAGGSGGIFGALFGGGGGSSGGGIGGWISGLFGGGSAPAASGAGDFTDWMAALPSFDVGAGDLASDMIAKVHKNEMIIPAATANKVRDTLSGRGGSGSGASGGDVHQHISFNVSGMMDKRTQSQVAKSVGDMAKRAVGRNG